MIVSLPSNRDDMVFVEVIVDRIEELEEKSASDCYAEEELGLLMEMMHDMKGYGGEVLWRGDWYPDMLIRDDYFISYAQDTAEELGLTPSTYQWPASHIDWRAAADDLKMDYSMVDYDGIDYWFRA